MPKLLAYQLLESVLAMPDDVRLVCSEGGFEPLLAELALHHIDVVLTDRAAPISGNLKVFSTQLGDFANGLVRQRRAGRALHRRAIREA